MFIPDFPPLRLKKLLKGSENYTPEASYVIENNLTNPWIVKTGAICATALIFLATNDEEVGSWFLAPQPVKLIEGKQSKYDFSYCMRILL